MTCTVKLEHSLWDNWQLTLLQILISVSEILSWTMEEHLTLHFSGSDQLGASSASGIYLFLTSHLYSALANWQCWCGRCDGDTRYKFKAAKTNLKKKPFCTSNDRLDMKETKYNFYINIGKCKSEEKVGLQNRFSFQDCARKFPPFGAAQSKCSCVRN